MVLSKVCYDLIKSNFPYEPYPPQAEYMRDVFSIIEEGKIGLLEAPSGFGKTSALLSSALAFPDHRIYYYSRTHAQMKQVAHELAKINEKTGKNFTCVVRGSRSQLCLDEQLNKMKDNMKAAEICYSRIKRVKNKRDPFEDYYSKRENAFLDNENQLSKMNLICKSNFGDFKIPSDIPHDVPVLADIKTLKKYGLENKICPYFLARLMAQHRKVVVGSYKYLFYDDYYQDQVVILDEAHNMEQFCKDGVSFALYLSTVEKALDEVREIDSSWASLFEELLLNLVMFFKYTEFKNGELLSSSQLLMELDKNGVTLEHVKSFIENWHLIQNVWSELRKIRKQFIIIENLKIVSVYEFFYNLIHSPEKSYKGIWSSKNKNNPNVSWFCLDGQLAFDQIKKKNPRAIILTSGTLSPQENIATRLGIEKPFVKSYPAIFSEENIQLLVLSKGLNKKSLTTSFSERGNPEIINDYGRTIVSITNNVPNGTIVFFPSYRVMKNMLELWERSEILDQLKALIFIESKEGKSNVYEMFRDEASKNKAVLFAVVRGKLSEGQNFPDSIGRAVIIVGIPYPNTKDPKLMAQRQYYDKKERGMGSKWYNDESFNAVNQALGRAWRHKDDYAMGFLLDSRYRTNLRNLSLWLERNATNIDIFTPFSTVEKMVQNFFKDKAK